MRWKLSFLLLTSVLALRAAADDAWTFSVTPYLFLPTINGTTRFNLPPASGDGRFDIELGPNDYLSNLQATAMLTGEARKGRFSIATDLVYLSFAGEKSNVRDVEIGGDRLPVDVTFNRDTQTSFKGTAWTLVGGYAIVSEPQSTFDVIGGFRYFGVRAQADWQLSGDVTLPGGGVSFPRSGNISRDSDLWDGIVGFRGRGTFAPRWSIPYYADIGGGSSDLTWQAMAGVTYSYGWGDVGVAYRHLAYDQKEDALMQNMSFSGPAILFSFHF
jgi:hypothetical protein